MVSPAIDHGDDADNLLRRELLEALRGTSVPAESALRRFVRNLRVEAMVLFAVVIAAAVLGASAPPGSG